MKNRMIRYAVQLGAKRPTCTNKDLVQLAIESETRPGRDCQYYSFLLMYKLRRLRTLYSRTDKCDLLYNCLTLHCTDFLCRFLVCLHFPTLLRVNKY